MLIVFHLQVLGVGASIPRMIGMAMVSQHLNKPEAARISQLAESNIGICFWQANVQ